MGLRETITSYHNDGTDYINDSLERKVHDAIATYLGPFDRRNLAALAAITAVVEWIDTLEGDNDES